MALWFGLIIGLPFGAITWTAIRGRGGLAGLALCLVFGLLGAFVGSLAAQAIEGPDSNAALGLGATVGGLLALVIATIALGPRPKESRVVRTEDGGESPPHGHGIVT